MPIHHVTAQTVEDIGVGLRVDGRLAAFIPVDEASRLAWELMDAVQACRKSDEAKGLDPDEYADPVRLAAQDDPRGERDL